MQQRDHESRIMELAIQVRYQTPTLSVEWDDRCTCGASARFPAPCASCATEGLSALAGKELANRWQAACVEQQAIWRDLEVHARGLASWEIPHGEGRLDRLNPGEVS